ncbi:MAG: hypothetical protein HY815_23695 [Candidatus Riflebacteria bacterium]|nr:hypothetical protein [Candidatus Riflebacteria bacterium]
MTFLSTTRAIVIESGRAEVGPPVRVLRSQARVRSLALRLCSGSRLSKVASSLSMLVTDPTSGAATPTIGRSIAGAAAVETGLVVPPGARAPSHGRWPTAQNAPAMTSARPTPARNDRPVSWATWLAAILILESVRAFHSASRTAAVRRQATVGSWFTGWRRVRRGIGWSFLHDSSILRLSSGTCISSAPE